MSPVKILCQQAILEFPTHSYNLVLFENITGQGKKYQYGQSRVILTREYSQYRHSRSNSRASFRHSSTICSLCHTEQGNPLRNKHQIRAVTFLKIPASRKITLFHILIGQRPLFSTFRLSFYVLPILKQL